MGFLDKAKDKLTDAVNSHGEKIADGIDKAGGAVDAKTGGKYSEKIATGQQQAKDALDRLDGSNDDIGPAGTTAPPEPVPTPADPNPTGPPPTEPAPDPAQQPGLPTDPANPATGEDLPRS